jgi:hypothetical protein
MKSLKQSKKSVERVVRRVCLLALLGCAVSATLGLSGCASTEPDNYSERPWDSPKSWETGLPSALTEGR